MPLLPPPPFPPSSRPGPSEPFQWHSLSTTLPFRFPVHCLHRSPHSLSSPCPFRPSSILQTSVGPGLLIPSAFFTLPLPSTNPPTPLYLTHKTPPTLTHWWFSTWGAQPRHPTDGSPPLTHHQFASTNPLTKQTLRTYLNTRHEDTWSKRCCAPHGAPP